MSVYTRFAIPANVYITVKGSEPEARALLKTLEYPEEGIIDLLPSLDLDIVVYLGDGSEMFDADTVSLSIEDQYEGEDAA